MIKRRALLSAAAITVLDRQARARPAPRGAQGEFELLADCSFGGKRGPGGIGDLEGLRRAFYFRYIYDNGRLDRMPYEWSRHTVYPEGDPRSLHVFENDCLVLKGRIPTGGGLWPGGIEAGLLRLKTPMHAGMYIEMKARIPRGIGLLPAFWLIPGVQYSDDRIVLSPWPPEIDIFEFLQFPSRPRPTVMEANIEVKGQPEQFGNPHDLFSKFHAGRYEPGIDFSADYHTFALDWVKDKPIWLIDGVPVKQTFYKWGSAPAVLMVSNQIGVTLQGVDVSHIRPEDSDWDFAIEHLRVWRRAG